MLATVAGRKNNFEFQYTLYLTSSTQNRHINLHTKVKFKTFQYLNGQEVLLDLRSRIRFNRCAVTACRYQKSTKVGFTKGHNVPVATGNDASLELEAYLLHRTRPVKDRLVIKRDANSIEGYLGVALDWASEEQVALQVTWSQVECQLDKKGLSKPRLLKGSGYQACVESR